MNWDNIDGKYLNNLRFADDIGLISDSLGEIKEMISDLMRACEEIGLKINMSKSKFMTNLVPSSNIDIDGCEVERVEAYIQVWKFTSEIYDIQCIRQRILPSSCTDE